VTGAKHVVWIQHACATSVADSDDPAEFNLNAARCKAGMEVSVKEQASPVEGVRAVASTDALQLTLVRTLQDNHHTKGYLILPSGMRLATIERPWKGNEPQVSCIPEGSYRARYTRSKRFGRLLYEVLDVPGRSGIRIHAANWAHELQGCIALGIAHGAGLVLQSRIAMQRFHDELDGRPFTLCIKGADDAGDPGSLK
jgi:hypothetical protein